MKDKQTTREPDPQPIVTAALAWSEAWGVLWDGDDSQSAHDNLSNASKSLYDAICDYKRGQATPETQ